MAEAIVNYISSGERPKNAYWLAASDCAGSSVTAPMSAIRALSSGVAATACPRKLTLLRWFTGDSGP